MERRLYRSRHNKVIAGVCGGIGEYFNIDPIIIRLAAIAFVFAGGAGFLAYIIAILIMNKRPDSQPYYGCTHHNNPDDWGSVAGDREAPMSFDRQKGRMVMGIILVIFGLLFFAKQFFHFVHIGSLWPLILIAVGLFIVNKSRRAF